MVAMASMSAAQEVAPLSTDVFSKDAQGRPNGDYVYEREVTQILLGSAKRTSSVQDFRTWTGLALPLDPQFQDPALKAAETAPHISTWYRTTFEGLYAAEFVARDGVADKDATFNPNNSNGYDFEFQITPQHLDVTECLSLADVKYYAERGGFSGFEMT